MTIKRYHDILRYLRKQIASSKFEGKVYAVGGCTRDEAMGKNTIKDVDLAVELPNGGLELAQFLRRKRLTIGNPTIFQRYGTAMLRLRVFPDDEIEIVQTRSKKYTGEENTCVEDFFGPIETDCLLRDLSINALYRNVSTGELIDPTGKGLEDIKAHRLRTTDEASKILEDDPQRILRLIRFSKNLGWELPTDILDALPLHADGLKNVKPERIRGEIEKMFGGQDPVGAYEMMEKVGIIGYVFPELEHLFNKPDIGEGLRAHALATVAQAASLSPNSSVRLAALFHDVGKACSPKGLNKKKETIYLDHESRGARITRKSMNHLHLDRDFSKEVVSLVGHHHFPIQTSYPGSESRALKRLARLIKDLGGKTPLVTDLFNLMEADRRATYGEDADLSTIEWLRSSSFKFLKKPKRSSKRR